MTWKKMVELYIRRKFTLTNDHLNVIKRYKIKRTITAKII